MPLAVDVDQPDLVDAGVLAELAGLHPQGDHVVGSTALATPRAASLSSAVRSVAATTVPGRAATAASVVGAGEASEADAGDQGDAAARPAAQTGTRRRDAARRPGPTGTDAADAAAPGRVDRRARTCANTCSRTRAGGATSGSAPARRRTSTREASRRVHVGAGLDVLAHGSRGSSSGSRTSSAS